MSPVGPLSRRDRRSGRPALPTALVVELLLVVALGWVLWVTARAEAAKAVAAAGHGRPGVMVIESLRPARGNDIPVGTFTDSDGTKTSGVAWQDRPARLGDRKGGVRVGNRAWGDGVRLGCGTFL